MTDIRPVTEQFAVAPQLQPSDVAVAARLGYRTLINNRPDGEAPDQPHSAAMRAAAEAEGLAYVEIPVRGGPTPDQVAAMAQALKTPAGSDARLL